MDSAPGWQAASRAPRRTQPGESIHPCRMGSLKLIQRAVSVSQHIHAARMFPVVTVRKIGDDESFGEGAFKKFAGKEAPVAGEGEILRLEVNEIVRDVGEQEAILKGREALGRVGQAQVGESKRVKRAESAAGDVIPIKERARIFAQSFFYAIRVNPPVHLKTIGGQSGVESVAHFAIF